MFVYVNKKNYERYYHSFMYFFIFVLFNMIDMLLFIATQTIYEFV